MAITNAQQYQQLVNPPMKGNKRPGYRGDDAARSSEGTSGGRADPGNASRGDGPATNAPSQDRIAEIRQANITLENLKQDKIEEKLEKFRNLGSKQRQFQNFLSKFSPISMFASKFGPLNNKDFFTNKVLGSKNFSNMTKEQFANLTNEEQEDMFGDYMSNRMSGATDAYGNPIGNRGGEGSEILLPQGIMAQAPSDIDQELEEDDEIINYRLMSKGGRASFRGGDAARSDAASGRDAGRADPSGGVDDRSNAGQTAVNNAAIMMAQMQNKGLNEITNPNLIEKFPSGRVIDKINLNKMMNNINLNTVTSDDDDDDDVNYPTSGSFLDPKLDKKKQAEIFQEFKADGGRIGLMGGGMPYEGGIMDLESARQMYGLGKLVKKITRGVKKIAKSPIGKAALAFGAYKLGGMDFGKGGSLFERFGNLSTLQKVGLGIGATSAIAGLMTPEEEEEESLYAGADIADPRYIMNNPGLFTNRRLAAEGGDIEKEPVAKKVMPLLDMDGKEKDYRETGGFVDMGRMEKADDVPARLSKNEFVFTADAVRNAGDGSVDKGAEVMYNMMKNLESGGDVSEESQGLEGARDMFQTSQRLEEVL